MLNKLHLCIILKFETELKNECFTNDNIKLIVYPSKMYNFVKNYRILSNRPNTSLILEVKFCEF